MEENRETLKVDEEVMPPSKLYSHLILFFQRRPNLPERFLLPVLCSHCPYTTTEEDDTM